MQKAYEDYTQLFIGPNSLHALLWESDYLDRKHSLFEEQTLQYT
ncbi:molecular chaperone TorD family protein [Bacillus siamensis]